MKNIYFIDDGLRTCQGWERKGIDSKGVFSVTSFLSPFKFMDFLLLNEIEEDSYIVVDQNGPGFDATYGFTSFVRSRALNFKGKFILVSSTFDSGKFPESEDYAHVFYKRDAIKHILELIKNEK